jgi:hypothetical protein
MLSSYFAEGIEVLAELPALAWASLNSNFGTALAGAAAGAIAGAWSAQLIARHTEAGVELRALSPSILKRRPSAPVVEPRAMSAPQSAGKDAHSRLSSFALARLWPTIAPCPASSVRAMFRLDPSRFMPWPVRTASALSRRGGSATLAIDVKRPIYYTRKAAILRLASKLNGAPPIV